MNMATAFVTDCSKAAHHLKYQQCITNATQTSNKNMASAFVTDCTKSSESTVTTTDMPMSLPKTKVASLPSGQRESKKDRRKKAYKWYKHYAKPTRASMCSIADYHSDEIGITRQDVDLLPWNPEETEVISEAMKSPKKKKKVAFMPPGRKDSDKSQDRRREMAYKWYKHYAKPAKASLCSIVDYYANDIDITRQDVDLLPWNPEETKVIREAMKFLKITEKIEKTEKNEKDNTEKERYGREDRAFAKSNCYNERPTLLKAQMGDSLRIQDLYGFSSSLDTSSSSLEGSFSSLDGSLSSLDGSSSSLGGSASSLDVSSSSWNQDHTSLDINGSSGTLDASSSSWDQDQEDCEVADHFLTIKVVDDFKRRKEERRLKREAKKKSMPEVDRQGKTTADKTTRNMDDRRERAFIWYARMASPTRTEFKRKVTSLNNVGSIDIGPEDIDLLPWNLTGKVVNIATMHAIIRASILKY